MQNEQVIKKLSDVPQHWKVMVLTKIVEWDRSCKGFQWSCWCLISFFFIPFPCYKVVVFFFFKYLHTWSLYIDYCCSWWDWYLLKTTGARVWFDWLLGMKKMACLHRHISKCELELSVRGWVFRRCLDTSNFFRFSHLTPAGLGGVKLVLRSQHNLRILESLELEGTWKSSFWLHAVPPKIQTLYQRVLSKCFLR